MTPEDWRELADIFRVRLGDPYRPHVVFHEAAKLFERVAAQMEQQLHDSVEGGHQDGEHPGQQAQRD